jgi:DNA repair protein RadC
VIKRALEFSASAIILVRNHPSGDPTPSFAAIDLKQRIKDAGSKLGITIYDHVNIARIGHTRFRGSWLI